MDLCSWTPKCCSSRRLGRSADALADEDSVGPSLDSCLVSGLVSLIVVDRSGKAFDVGGLQPAASRELAVPMRRWLNLRRDDIRFVPEHRVHPVLRNDVRVNGQVQRPEDFVDDLCAGFESTYRFLEANCAALLAADGPLSGFADCRARVLFRPSDQYAAAQYLLAAPRYQRRGLDRSLAIEMFDRVFIREIERPRLWPLVHDERQALEALDIPRVTLPASGTDLEATTGEVVHDYYARSGVEAMRSRLAAFSARRPGVPDRSTADRSGQPRCCRRPRALGTNAGSDDDLRAAAERVGLALLGRAHQGPDGSLRWPSSSGRTDLYSGASGIGLFFAALAAVTRRETMAGRGTAGVAGNRRRRSRAGSRAGGLASAAAGPRSPTRSRSPGICSRTSAWSPGQENWRRPFPSTRLTPMSCSTSKAARPARWSRSSRSTRSVLTTV